MDMRARIPTSLRSARPVCKTAAVSLEPDASKMMPCSEPEKITLESASVTPVRQPLGRAETPTKSWKRYRDSSDTVGAKEEVWVVARVVAVREAVRAEERVVVRAVVAREVVARARAVAVARAQAMTAAAAVAAMVAVWVAAGAVVD